MNSATVFPLAPFRTAKSHIHDAGGHSALCVAIGSGINYGTMTLMRLLEKSINPGIEAPRDGLPGSGEAPAWFDDLSARVRQERPVKSQPAWEFAR